MSSILRATAIIAVFSIISKILGLVRHMIFAYRLGAGPEADIYVAAFRIPDLIFNLLVLGTLSVAFIPVFARYLESNREEAFRIASTIFNLALLVMGILAVIAAVFSPLLIELIVPGFSAESKAVTASLTRLLMISPLLFTLSSVLTSVLQSHKRFLLAAISPLLYNLGIIFGIIFLYPTLGLKGIVYGVLAGAFCHFALQFPSVLRMGLRPLAILDLKSEGVRKIGKLFLPRIFGVDLGQVSMIVASIIGSMIGTGSLAVVYYAYELNAVPLGVVAVSFAVASFPNFVAHFSKNDIDGFKATFASIVIRMLFLVVPLSVALLLLRAQLTRLIFGAGQGTEFDFDATRKTALTLGFFAVSLFAQSLIPILARAFYALQNTILPVLASGAAIILNAFLGYFLTKQTGRPETLGLAFSIAAVFNMLILFVALRRRLGDLHDEFLAVRMIKILFAAASMGIIVYLSLYIVAPFVNMTSYFGILIQTLVSGALGFGMYFGAGLLIKLPESQQIVAILKEWFNKFTRPVTSAIINLFTDTH